METVRGKKNFICLILACRKPPYIARRSRQHAMLARMRELGIPYFYVVGVGRGAETRIVGEELEVPADDSYESLAEKIYLAYSWILGDPTIEGVLKIDDDTVITTDEPYEDIWASDADYMGKVLCERRKDQIELNRVNRNSFSRSQERIFIIHDRTFGFFHGPCYYLSRRAIHLIRLYGMIYPLEDVSIGYTLSSFPDLNVYVQDGWKYTNEPDPLSRERRRIYISLRENAMNDAETILSRLVSYAERQRATLFFSNDSCISDTLLSRYPTIEYDMNEKEMPDMHIRDCLPEEFARKLVIESSISIAFENDERNCR